MRNDFIENIDAETVAKLEPVRFGGKVIVVEDEQTATRACEDLLSYPAIGFDTETRPSFKAGVMNKVSLLQLSTPTTCYLFRLSRMPLEKCIIKVLENKDVLKIGADVPNDIKALQQLRHFKPGGFTDLQTIASQWGIADKSVRKLAAIILGKRVSKAQRLSNWEAATLTPAQCSYAATDAWVCLEMHTVLGKTDTNPLPVPETAPKKKESVEKPRRKFKFRRRPKTTEQQADNKTK